MSEAAKRQEIWKEALKGWNVIESQIVKEWQEQARVEERVQNLLSILRIRFGKIPANLEKKIQAKEPDVLKELVEQALRVVTLDEFRKLV